jgi:putative oxidoreductase
MSSSIVKVHERVAAVLARIQWLSPLLLRIAIGVTFAVTGWGKLHNLDKITAYFDSLGIPGASVQAPFVATVEFVGGIVLILGLGTRIAAALLSGVMIVATLTAIWPDTGGVVALLGTIEIAYLLVFVHLVIHGAGAASIDHLVARRLGAATATAAPASTQSRGASA